MMRYSQRKRWDSMLVLCRAQGSPKEQVGPVEFAVTVPGCTPIEATIQLPWLGRGVGSDTLKVPSISKCFGSIVIQPVGEGEHGVPRPGTLYLKDRTSGERCFIGIDLDDAESCAISGVPCGTYQVNFRARDTYYQWPRNGVESQELVVLDKGGPAYVAMDVSDAGVLNIEIVDQSGGQYRDWWYASLEEGPRDLTTAIGCNMLAAPYRIGLVPPGAYRIRVQFISSNVEVLEPYTAVKVESGMTGACVIPIRRLSTW